MLLASVLQNPLWATEINITGSFQAVNTTVLGKDASQRNLHVLYTYYRNIV